MGDCKSGMQATNDKTKSGFGKLLARAKGKETKPKAASDEQVAKTFVDHIVSADDQIEILIGTKERDIANEPGKEKENKRKVKLLEQMQKHIEMIAELAEEYTNL